MQQVMTFLTSGQAAGLVLLIVLAEGVFLALRHSRAVAERAALAAWLSPLGAGAALVVALWLSQTNAAPQWIGLALTLAGLSHLAGFRRRWYS